MTDIETLHQFIYATYPLKGHRPAALLDAHTVLDTFIRQQHELLELLELAKTKNIGSIRTPISISRLIRLKLGDTFRFLIAHEQRHFIQVKNTLAAVKRTPSFSMAF
jgi:DinB superfamily